MTIDKIYNNNEITVRSYHACKYNKIDTIEDLLKYYYKHKSFFKLRNCGEKSNKELIDICSKYEGNFLKNLEFENEKDKPLKLVISELTRVQREVINSFILVNTNGLSVRSKNAITLHLNRNFKIINFANKILLFESFDVQKIKNVGAKSVSELEVYISNIKDFIFEVSQTKDEKYLIALKNKYLIQRTFDIPFVPSEILESESIFLLTDFLFNQNAFFDETQTIIVKKALKLYNDQKELKLDEIAEQVNLTRERVRQIRKLCLEELFRKLLFISNFNDDLFQNYSIDTELSYIKINTDVLEKINNSNNTHFSKEFITYILSAYLIHSFTLVGNYEDVLQPKYFNLRNRHNWNNFYLVDNELASEIDFIALTNDISIRINDKIDKSYSFNFKSYLSKFLTNNKIDILDLLCPICETIINDEFEIYLDLDENIIFNRNTKKHIHEYAYEALEQLGKPSKVKEIYSRVIELHPNYDTKEAKIRASMKRKNGFVPVGRKSVFGLKKWENELENFKGGTIKGIIIQYLENYNVPIHISEILKEVNKYRAKTNERNIITNLKLDTNNSFVVFNQKFIGLSDKKNKYNLIKYENLPVQLGKYILVKYRRGYSIDDIKLNLKKMFDLTFEESELIISNLKYFKQNKIFRVKNSYLKNKLPELTEKFDRSSRSTKYSLGGLINFIEDNQKMPDSRDPDERNLYQFYYRNKKDLQKNTALNSEQLKLSELIKKYGKSSRATKYSLDTLINFIKGNQRMPDSRNQNEKNLYQFYYRKKKDLENNTSLNSEQLKLSELIKKYGKSNRGTKYSFDELITFIKDNQRLPHSGSSNENNLYRYFHNQKKKLSILSSLSNEQLLLKTIIEKYKNTSQRESHSIKELVEFINFNYRIPNSRNQNEKNLYQFYYRKKKDLENNTSLNSEQLKLSELIKKYGKSSRGTKYSLDTLINFIEDNQKMPDSRDPDERNLYQFYYRNKKDLQNNTALNSEQLKLSELIKKYGKSSRGTKYSLDTLINFIEDNQRMPDSRDPEERNLYHFYYRKRKLYNQYELGPEEITEFIKVEKLLQKF